MAHKKALAALTVAALSVTGAVVVPAPALAAYAKQGTDKHVEDVFWLDLAGVTNPEGYLIPGAEKEVPGLDGYTVKVKVGAEKSTLMADKKPAAFEVEGASTLVSTDKSAKQELTVTLTKGDAPEPLTLVLADLNGQNSKVITSAEPWSSSAPEVTPDRLNSPSFSTITCPDSSIVPLVRTENKENSTTLTLEMGAGEQKAMIGILKARPEAQPTSSADPVKALMELNEAIGAGARAVSDALPASASETPSSSSETSSASAELATTVTSESATADPTMSATSGPSSREESASTAAEESTSEESTEATSAETSESTTTTQAEPSTEEPTSSTPSEDAQPANPNLNPDGTSGSASISGNGTNNPPSNPSLEPGITLPDPPKADGDSSSSSGAPDTDAVIGTVIGVLIVGGLGAGMLGGAVDKVMTPVSPSNSNSNAKNQRPQQKKPKVTVKQPNGESLTLAEMQQRSNSKSAPTTKSASIGKPKVSTKSKSSTRQAQQNKPRISVGKKSSTKAANSSKKKLADTGAPIGLPIGLASLLIMSGLVLLGVRQRRSQI